jgi:hypothetical protein
VNAAIRNSERIATLAFTLFGTKGVGAKRRGDVET